MVMCGGFGSGRHGAPFSVNSGRRTCCQECLGDRTPLPESAPLRRNSAAMSARRDSVPCSTLGSCQRPCRVPHVQKRLTHRWCARLCNFIFFCCPTAGCAAVFIHEFNHERSNVVTPASACEDTIVAGTGFDMACLLVVGQTGAQV